MLNIKTDIKFSSQHKTNMKFNANSLLYTTLRTIKREEKNNLLAFMILKSYTLSSIVKGLN